LALDESENSKDFMIEDNSINILLDQNMRRIVDNGRSITIDFHESRFGSGFTIDTGFSC
jgi:Fe-S cluster assembly iron-binding protein IscA